MADSTIHQDSLTTTTRGETKEAVTFASPSTEDNSEINSEVNLKKSSKGIVLVPQPSDNPKDPLNWPVRKKLSILATLCLAGCAGIGGPTTSLLSFEPQADLYDKTVAQISYSIAASVAAMISGPFVIVPLAKKFGRASIMFWSLFSVLLTQIWAARMIGHGQYVAFILSRLFSGFGGAVPSILGAQIITDIFYIHERGRAFSIFHLCFLFGPVGIPTISGFVSAHADWTVMYWWTLGLLGLSLLCIVLFVEETGYDREGGDKYPPQPESFAANRVATFLPGNKIVPRISFSDLSTTFVNQLFIAITPVTIILGLFAFVSFGFQLMLTVQQNVFIEEPVIIGGLGHDLEWNSLYSFCSWVALGSASLYGHFVNDRLPLWLCKRRGGVWKPEYRLHSMWIPAFILLPVGLGLFGAALEYRLHYMVLATGTYLTVFGAMASAPVLTNYLIESFTHYPTECSVVMSAYRLTLGMTTSFYIDYWVDAVGNGWVFGMAAFFSIFSFSFVVLLMFKGKAIRKIQVKDLSSSEEGVKLIEADSVNGEKGGE